MTGDRCGCPDDRCIGFHHAAGEPCPCVAALSTPTYAERVRSISCPRCGAEPGEWCIKRLDGRIERAPACFARQVAYDSLGGVSA